MFLHFLKTLYLMLPKYNKTFDSTEYLLYHWFNKGIPQVQVEELASLSESD